MNKYFESSGTIGFTCDVCGRELQSCTIVNGMKFCAKCYQETYGNNTIQFVDLLNREMEELIKLYKCKKEPTTAVGCQKLIEPFICQIEKLKFANYQKDKKMADLEAKLAESEKKFIVANNLRKNSDEVLLNYKTEKYGLDKTIQELRKMKLSLPEKEWYYKGFENCERQMSSHIAELTLEVKQLKQQLEEKETRIDELEDKDWYEGTIKQLEEQNEKLLNKLADKEEEIKQLNNRILLSQLQAPKEQILNILGSQCIQCNPEQDKISFAIEKLENVKKTFIDVAWKDVDFAIEIIDSQIKQLKGDKGDAKSE